MSTVERVLKSALKNGLKVEQFIMDEFKLDEVEFTGSVVDEDNTGVMIMVNEDSGAVIKMYNGIVQDMHFMRFTSDDHHDKLLLLAEVINGCDVDEATERLNHINTIIEQEDMLS